MTYDLDNLPPPLHALLMRFLDHIVEHGEASWLDFEAEFGREVTQEQFEALADDVGEYMRTLDH